MHFRYKRLAPYPQHRHPARATCYLQQLHKQLTAHPGISWCDTVSSRPRFPAAYFDTHAALVQGVYSPVQPRAALATFWQSWQQRQLSARNSKC
jgi:hypothetical protein